MLIALQDTEISLIRSLINPDGSPDAEGHVAVFNLNDADWEHMKQALREVYKLDDAGIEARWPGEFRRIVLAEFRTGVYEGNTGMGSVMGNRNPLWDAWTKIKLTNPVGANYFYGGGNETTYEIPSYGSCDSPEQFLRDVDLESSAAKYIVVFSQLTREHDSGWRWHKNGPYIGHRTPECEHLGEEPEIDSIYSFHVYSYTEGCKHTSISRDALSYATTQECPDCHCCIFIC